MADRRDESGGAGGGRSKRKKQRRGGAAPQRHQQPNAHSIGGGKSRRQQARQQTAGPCAAFLAALEEQRENERRRQELQQHLQADEVTEAVAQASATVPANQRDQRQSAPIAPAASAQQPAAPVAQIAGFYYDEAQKRYFKLTPQIKQQVKQMKQVHIAKEKDAPQQELRPLHVEVSESRHRITSLDLQAKGDGYGAMGFTGGRVEIFTVDHRSDLRSGFARQGERRITSVQQQFAAASYQVSAVKWRPVDPRERISDLLYACVGGDPSAESTGFVSLVRPFSSPESKWPFNDPWSVEWCPGRATRSFAVGLSGCAAYVDIAARDGVTGAPVGKIKSDVMAQAFSSDGNTILNGTRNGSTWLWDLRASRRAHEHLVVPSKSSSQTAGGAILDLHVLNGDFQVLVLKSNGELRLVDTRGAQRKEKDSNVVVEYAAGGSNTYLPMLKCAVDDTETVVIATGSDRRGDGVTGCGASTTVCSYQISTGALLSQMTVNESQSSKAIAPLEQVHLRRSSNGDAMPEIYALSRNELFASAHKREAPNIQHR
ncbi:hypothetical protein Gpo141_00002161 [Globisporangium polare]